MKKKKTPKQQYHQDIFYFLMAFGMKYRHMPNKIYEAIDVVGDYVGDIAMGRRK
jgi:hypothetical protein